MSGPEQLILHPASLAAIAALMVGFGALWANPKRAINRVFFTGSLHVSAWLLCFELAVGREGGLLWLRWATAIGGFLPLHLWTLAAVVRGISSRVWLRRAWPWLLAAVVLAVICFSDWFIPSYSSRDAKVFGLGYFVYIGGVLALYLVLLVQTLWQARATSGVQRLELQVLLLGGCAACFTAITLMVLNAIVQDPIYIRLQPLVVLVFYGGTAWAMLTSRVFDARHMLFIGLQKLFLVLAVALFIWAANELLAMLMPPPLAFVLAIGLGLWFAASAGPWFQLVFDVNLRGEDARRAAFKAARSESRPERLESAFVQLLRSWSNADRAYVLMHANGQLRGEGMELPANGEVVRALSELRWATPERLARQKLEPHEIGLQRFMAEENIGVMVALGGQSLNLILAVGVPVTRRPFTYPQVAQLVELASIMESAMDRAQYSVKAQHAEQLATVGLLGASLAHEIRNPLVTIKTFVQLLPKHYADPIFREKFFTLIGEEVSRIDRLTEQLLDLATPRAYTPKPVELHAVLLNSVELASAKADDRQIRIIKEFHAAPDTVFTDSNAVKQVLLNLCFNAIQAVEHQEGDRWIKLTTQNLDDGVQLVIEDNGPGIAAEMLPRLFQPFQSSKSTGFGLGLAICSDILRSLKATITVDPPTAGRGATFRINFPCRAS
ncbi:MAG: ATP-binding protein [Opitutaceae bacterium]